MVVFPLAVKAKHCEGKLGYPAVQTTHAHLSQRADSPWWPPGGLQPAAATREPSVVWDLRDASQNKFLCAIPSESVVALLIPHLQDLSWWQLSNSWAYDDKCHYTPPTGLSGHTSLTTTSSCSDIWETLCIIFTKTKEIRGQNRKW